MADVGLAVGLCCDCAAIEPYVRELGAWVRRHPGIGSCQLFVTAQGSAASQRTPARAFVAESIVRFERWRFQRSHHYRTHRAAVEAPYSAGEDEPHELDLVIVFGQPAWEIARARGGDACVWVVTFGEDNVDPDDWTGFGEVHRGEAKSRFAIHQVVGNEAASMLILSGAFPTQTYFLLNQSHLFRRTVQQVKGLLSKRCANPDWPAPIDGLPTSAAQHPAATSKDWLGYGASVVARSLRSRVRKLLRIEERWGISYQHRDWRAAVLRDGIEVQNPTGRYFADPFLAADGNGNTFCFVEDYFDDTGRGVISVLQLDNRGAHFLGHALEEGFHLSFPFMFEHQGVRYMCPEASESRQIRIYECVNFPLRWRLHSIAMDNVAAVDTLIFPHDGRWWMLTNLDSSDIGEYGSELHVFHADDPLSGRWVPHHRNPVRIDSEYSRNGGMLREGSTVFRVAQARGFGSYGVYSTVFEIDVLSVDRYAEHAVTTVRPSFKQGVTGTHHFHGGAGYCAWDHKKLERVR